ncbi:MAG: biotin transporter BioY [Bifidobacteriaceae bacterium]|jgi:biotin transport system substrate-specific component|nr:biotin transporter BioY [Bifidobacteriaceae bacterium]
MSAATLPNLPRGQHLVLADLLGRSCAKDAGLAVIGAAWVALASQIAIPLGFTPVPLSLGTFAVLTVGSALGSQRGLAAVAIFAAAGWLGAPVFAGGHHGLELPTSGYILGYMLAAFFVGRAAEQGWDRSAIRAFAVMAGASAVIYLFGVPYLVFATNTGWWPAIAQGAVPFIPGDLLKAAAAGASIPALWHLLAARRATRTKSSEPEKKSTSA